MTGVSVSSSGGVPEKFHSREELVAFIEQEARAAVSRAAQGPPGGAVRVERRVPWVTSGPVLQDSAGYSVLKAAALALGFVGPEQAKEELHVHEQLRQLYGGYGFVPHQGQQSFLVPLASAHLPAFEPQGQRLREELRQKLSAATERYDPDEAAWLRRRTSPWSKALGTVSDSAGGTLVAGPHVGELIDLQRSLEVFSAAGAREVALPPNGRLQFPKLTAASTAYWVGEGASIPESQPATGMLSLQAKKLGVLVRLNNELLRFASPSAEGLVRYDMARAAALKADLAMLEGSGGTQIQGLLTYPDIVVHPASAPGTNGDLFQPQDVALMESRLPDAVEAPTAWVMRKSMYAALMNRRTDAISTGDNRGVFLFREPQAGDPNPPKLFGTRVVRSAQVSNSRTKGSASNLTYILLGYFPDWIIARLGIMEFLASGLGDSALQNDQTVLRGIQHIDAGPRHAASFVLCDQLVIA
jgi:HK97 family phage major capsid protein